MKKYKFNPRVYPAPLDTTKSPLAGHYQQEKQIDFNNWDKRNQRIRQTLRTSPYYKKREDETT